ncbi:MAG: SpoIIE family protein phosphatase, partial [Ignavibacteria bacterium]|nr:SpoIIE family protein phosphatase [Ignavibacteria bacterium]
MRLLVNRISSTSAVVVLSFVVIILKVIFNFYQALFFTVIFDLVLIVFFISLSTFLQEKIRNNQVSPINLTINALVISAIILFLSELSFAVFENVFTSLGRLIKERNIFVLIISSFYSIIVLIGASYIFSAFTYLFFLKQRKNLRLYFNSMLVFLVLASLSNIINGESQLGFIKLTFDSICVILFFVNSVRISWIAFLTKKHKLYLLLISIGLLILSGLNISNFESSEMIAQIIYIFSPSLVHFTFLLFVYSPIYFGMLFFSTLFHLPTTDVFERKAKEVSSLQDFSKLLTQIFDFSELADNVTEITMSVCKADCSWLSIFNQHEKNNKPISLKNIRLEEAIQIESLIQEKFIQEKIGLGEIRLTQLKLKNEFKHLGSLYPVFAFSELKIHEKVIGYLFAGRKANIGFDTDDLNAMKSFAEYSAIAIENSRLLKESIEKERLEKELDVAREVQLKILPRYTPNFENLDISSVFIPAFEVGGDYFDFFELSKNELGIVIADVSGKGISSAFYMAEVKGIFESLSKLLRSPREILIQANQILKKSMDLKSFVSAIY